MSKNEILFGLGAMLVGAFLTPVAGYSSAVVGLIFGTALIIAAVYGRDTDSSNKLSNTLPRITANGESLIGSGKLDLTLTPSNGPSDKMILTVTNNGKGQKFHAQCKILSRRNDPNRLFQKPYDLLWEGHKYRETHIVRGESRNLLIAEADENFQYQSEEVSLIERVHGGSKSEVERSRWNRNKAGPEYDLEISVFGEGDNKPHIERFTLKCGGKFCALEMANLQS